MIDSRQNYRLRKQLELTWSATSFNVKGVGRIFNISQKGMLIVLEGLSKPTHGQMIEFGVAQMTAFPSKGKLVWFRKVGKDTGKYQCGVKFLNETALNPLWIQWMEDNILKLADAQDNKILERLLND